MKAALSAVRHFGSGTVWLARARYGLGAAGRSQGILPGRRRLHAAAAPAPVEAQVAAAAAEAAPGTATAREAASAPAAALRADGWTPYPGTVVNITEFGAFVDFGFDKRGLLPRRGSQAADGEALDKIAVGDELTVYVTSRQRDTGKINLSLSPRERPNHKLSRIIADGRTPYPAKVANISQIGTFFDVGAEQQAFLPTAAGGGPGHALAVGDEATVYIVGKRPSTGKLHCSLEPETVTRLSWRDLATDGQTPYRGTVVSVNPAIGAFIDIGVDTSAVLPARTERFDGRADLAQEDEERVLALQPGQEVVVYVTHYTENTHKVSVSLEPLPRPLLPWKDIVADGQTRLDGVITNKTDFGAFVHFGCAHRGLIPASNTDPSVFTSLRIGQKLPVYVSTKCRKSGRITLRLTRAARPRERWEAVLTDGQTPYLGVVKASSWFGVYVDIGCESDGRIATKHGVEDPRLAALKVGDEVTTYVIEKRSDVGTIGLSLDRRDEPLIHWKDLVVDGQTSYLGEVLSRHAGGLTVDIGSDISGLVPRSTRTGEGRAAESEAASATDQQLEPFDVGSKVTVYIFRRNPANGRLTLSLTPSSTPRIPLDDALRDRVTPHLGVIYAMEYGWALMDFGCEASGCLARDLAPAGLAVGDKLWVIAQGFDGDRGRVIVARARPPPPQRPSVG